MAAGLLVSIFLGRTLGADGLGIINLANRVVFLVLILTMFGLDNVLIKRIAIAYERKNWNSIKNSINTALVISLSIALLLSSLGIISADFLSSKVFHSAQLKIPMIIALIMIIPQTLSRIYAAGLIGFRKIWQSNLVNETLSMWVVLILLTISYVFKIEITVISAAVIYAIGRIAVTLSVKTYWKKIFHFKGGEKQWQTKSMLKTALPLLLVTSTSVIASNADAIMLGWLSTTREVGLYSVAARIALLVSFFLQVSNSAIAPKLASLYADGKLKDMEKMVKSVTTVLIIIGTISLIFFVLAGKLLLGFWGEEFKAAYLILIVLGIGQLLNISTGCSGMLLIMCGHERTHGKISLASLIINLILNYFLIKSNGAVGAAYATAITLGTENITKLILAKRKIGILTIPKI